MATTTPPKYDAKTGFVTDYGLSVGAKPVQPGDTGKGNAGISAISAQMNQVPDLTNKVNVAQQALGIKNQIDNLTAQKNALAQYGVSDTNDLPVAVKSQLGIDLVTSPSSTGNDTLDKFQEGTQKLANDLINNGYTVPKTLEITPSLISQFLDYAKTTVDPYYQQQIDSELVNIKNNLDNMASQYGISKANQIQDYGTNLATEQGQAEGNGMMLFSGQRRLNEQNLTNTTNRNLASLASQSAYDIGSAARTAAANVGATNAANISLPSLTQGSVSQYGGQRGTSGEGTTLDYGYNPSIYAVGNTPAAQKSAEQGLQQTYLNNYGTLAGAQSNSGRSVQDLIGMMGLS